MPDTKRKRDHRDIDGEQVKEVQPDSPLAFTCICFEGCFYTTDNQGMFAHVNVEGVPKLYRCGELPHGEVVFTFIQALSAAEMNSLEHIGDLDANTSLLM